MNRETNQATNSREVEIDLLKLLRAYLRKWWLILLCAVLVGGAVLAYSIYFVTPLYRAQTSIYVNNSSGNQQVESVTTANINASQALVTTYITITKSDRVLNAVAEALDNQYTTKQLSGMVSASQINGTEVFYIYVSHPNAQEAARIANVIGEVAPAEISTIVEGSSAWVLDYAQVPTSLYSPSYIRNLIIGCLIGAVLAAAYVTIVFLTNTRIEEEQNLTDIRPYPILGQIPDFTLLSSSKHSSKRKQKKDAKKAAKAAKKGGGQA